MRNLKKFLAVILAVAVMASAMIPAFAEEAYTYEAQAEALFDLGLISGDGVDFAYGRDLTRAEGITMALKLFGYQEEADAITDEEIDEALAGYADADAVKASWAKGWLAIGVREGIVSGNSKNEIDPGYKFTGKMLAALILKLMGQELTAETYNKACVELANIGGLNAAEVLFNDAQLNRDAAFGIMYAALGAQYEDGTTIADALVDSGVIDADLAAEYGLVESATIASVENITGAVKVGEEYTLPETVTATMSDGTTQDVAVTWEPATIDTSAVGAKTAAGTIEGYDAGITATVTVSELALEVESVTAVNHKEIVAVFNQELDGDTVTAANFSLGTGNATTPSLGDDGKTVTVVVADADAVATQPLALTLTISGVKSADGVELAEDYEADLSIFDVARPTVEGITLTGPKSFSITFSEPIKTTPAVKVNNGIYGLSVDALDGSNVVGVTLSASSLPEANYNVEISGYKDYAGIAGDKTTLTLAYVKDKTIPTATIKSATQTQVKVAFDKAVTLDASFGSGAYEDYFYHTFSTWRPDTVTASADKKTYTLSFNTYPINEGSFNLVIDYNGANDKKIKDDWGNEVTSNIILSGSVTADKTAPTVTKVEFKSESVTKVYFSEKMDNGNGEMNDEGNYTVKDADGKKITAFTAAYDDSGEDVVTTLTFSPALSGGNYTVEVSGVEDQALTPNALVPVAMAFTVTDKTPIDPSVASAITAEFVNGGGTNDDIIYVTFAEKMVTTGAFSVLNPSNYLLDSNNDGTYAALSDKAKLELFGTTGKVVAITIPNDAALTDGTSKLQIARVADLAGNTFTQLAVTETLAELTPAGVDVTEVAQTDYNKVKITINKPLKVVLASGFKSEGGAEVAAIDSWSVNDDNQTIIYATLAAGSASAEDDTDDIITAFDVVGNILVTETGLKMAAEDVKAVIKDKWAPKFDEVAQVDDDQFTITLTETIDADVDDNFAATDLVIKNGDGDQLVAGNDYTVATAGAVITVTLASALTEDETLTIGTIAAPVYIKDDDKGAGKGINKLVAFSGKELDMDLTGPTASVSIGGTADDAVTAHDTITVTFSEATDKPALTDASFTIANGHTLDLANGGSAVWNAAGTVLTITLGDTPTLVKDDTIKFAAASTVEDVYGNDFGTGTIYTIPTLAGSAW